MRVGAVAAKEFWGLVRRSQLLLLLLMGPNLIVVAFGLSREVQSVPQPRLCRNKPGSEGAELFEEYRYEFTNRTTSVETTRRSLEGGSCAARWTRRSPYPQSSQVPRSFDYGLEEGRKLEC